MLISRLVLTLFIPPALLAQIPPVTGAPITLATMRYIEIQPGTGAPAAAGRKLTVHYTGWLSNGKKFDSSVDRKQPFVFVQGRRQVISGWEVGFEGMKVGGKRRLIIPYQLGYGDIGSGTTIPPQAELTFDVELLQVDDAPTTAAGVDVLAPIERLEIRTLALARSIPAEKFSGRVVDIFRKIAILNVVMLDTANNDLTDALREKRLQDGLQNMASARDGIMTLLGSSFSDVKKQLETARAGYLGGDITLLGKPSTRRGVFVELEVEIAELLGEAAALVR